MNMDNQQTKGSQTNVNVNVNVSSCHTGTNYHHQAGVPDGPSRCLFPPDCYKERGLRKHELQETGFKGFRHVRCPDEKHSCPHCERNLCHIDTLIVDIAISLGRKAEARDPGYTLDRWGDRRIDRSACGVFFRPDESENHQRPSDNLFWRLPNNEDQDHSFIRATLHAAIGGISSALKYVRNGGQWDCDTTSPEHGPIICHVRYLVVKVLASFLVAGLVSDFQLKGKQKMDLENSRIRCPDLWETLLSTVQEVENAGAKISFWLVSGDERDGMKEVMALAQRGLTLELEEQK